MCRLAHGDGGLFGGSGHFGCFAQHAIRHLRAAGCLLTQQARLVGDVMSRATDVGFKLF